MAGAATGSGMGIWLGPAHDTGLQDRSQGLAPTARALQSRGRLPVFDTAYVFQDGTCGLFSNRSW